MVSTFKRPKPNHFSKSKKKSPAITIDLATVLDRDVLDAKKLFNLSIEKQRPELATLAAKLAIQKPLAR